MFKALKYTAISPALKHCHLSYNAMFQALKYCRVQVLKSMCLCSSILPRFRLSLLPYFRLSAVALFSGAQILPCFGIWNTAMLQVLNAMCHSLNFCHVPGSEILPWQRHHTSRHQTTLCPASQQREQCSSQTRWVFQSANRWFFQSANHTVSC